MDKSRGFPRTLVDFRTEALLKHPRENSLFINVITVSNRKNLYKSKQNIYVPTVKETFIQSITLLHLTNTVLGLQAIAKRKQS